jgi:rfaE bifunctional protein kinase chain/domain
MSRAVSPQPTKFSASKASSQSSKVSKVSRDALGAALGCFAQGKVLIVGDVMLDAYLTGDAERISPEAPVPVVHVTEERHLLGGSGNVARNIASLGGQAVLIGARGADLAGERLADLLQDSSVQHELSVLEDRPTIVKTRILARGQQMLRFDRELIHPFTETEEKAVLQMASAHMGQCKAVVVSDYGKGLVSPSFMQGLRQQIGTSPIPVLVDPKPQNLMTYKGVTLLTPNAVETGASVHMPVKTPAEVVAAGRAIMRLLDCPYLVTTLGAGGMAVFEGEDSVRHLPTVARKVFDVTGAGDTVIATIALALSVGVPLLEACILANHAAGIGVGEIGAAAVSAAQLQAAIAAEAQPIIESW